MKERILRLQKDKRIKNATFERMIKVGNGYLRTVKNPSNRVIEDVLRAFPDVSREWLYFGVGDMYIGNMSVPAISINGGTNTNFNMNINQDSNKTEVVEEAEVVEDFETAPVIPSVWAKRTNFDIVEAIEERSGELEKSRVAVAGTQIDAWHIITDNSMFPYFYKGDKVALAIAPTKKIMPGCMYGLDTIPHGLIVRTLFETENGYRAHAYNSDEYPDFILAEEDVQNILRVICSFRI